MDLFYGSAPSSVAPGDEGSAFLVIELKFLRNRIGAACKVYYVLIFFEFSSEFVDIFPFISSFVERKHGIIRALICYINMKCLQYYSGCGFTFD